MKLSTLSVATTFIATTGLVFAQDHGEEYSQTMGPVAFMWPPDRAWSEDYETTAPCGTAAGPLTNRSMFPLDNGHIALVSQDEAWAVQVRISFRSNPTSQNDFQAWFTSNITNELDEAHMCYQTPSVPSSIEEGDFGTIQLEYNAIDGLENISHFACADVYFVEKVNFKNNGYSSLCFNTTEDETAPDTTIDEDKVSGNNTNTASTSTTATPAAATSAVTSAATSTSSDSGAHHLALSGVLGAAGLIAALL